MKAKDIEKYLKQRKVDPDSEVFVLLERDRNAPAAVRFWCQEAVADRPAAQDQAHSDAKVVEALKCAETMAVNRERITAAKFSASFNLNGAAPKTTRKKTAAKPATGEAPRRPGRPKGSKNKPKEGAAATSPI